MKKSLFTSNLIKISIYTQYRYVGGANKNPFKHRKQHRQAFFSFVLMIHITCHTALQRLLTTLKRDGILIISILIIIQTVLLYIFFKYTEAVIMKISGAIFDLDGTLLDSTEMWRGAASRYITSLRKKS